MRTSRIQLPTFLALIVVAVVIGVTVRFSTFTPWGTDSAAYIDAAHRWADADLFSPTTFVFWAPWSFGGHVEIPLGQRLGPTIGSAVGIYPLGYPLLLAAALNVGGSLAPYAVAPLFAGLLAWCAYLLTSRFSGPWAGVMASVLIAATPVTLAHAISPMSDVPATALWALSWVLSLRPGLGAATASGLAAAFAIMIRPNLAPLAGIIVLVIAASAGAWAHRTKRVLTFAAATMVGPAMVLWSQGVLYGDPLMSGYGSVRELFSTERILTNLALYPRLFIELHGWLVVVGLLAFPLNILRTRERLLLAMAGVGFIVTNLALYLPYFTYDGWNWLRFMLPALLAVFVLFAASMDRIRRLLAARSPLLATLVVLPVLMVVLNAREEIRQLFLDGQHFKRVQVMGDYLREAVPANAVILTYLQSAAVAYYTGRPVIRLDYLDSTPLDSVVKDLSRRGYQPVFIIDEAMEEPQFRGWFSDSTFEALEWPARAEFWSNTRLLYLLPADRERYANDETYSVDLLGSPRPTSSFNEPMSAHHSQSEPFPPMHESIAFRRMLEDKYSNDLHRATAPTYIDVATSVTWTQRYIRYRLHACSHAEALRRVFQQMNERGISPGCAARLTNIFPPRDDVVNFRRQLEFKFRDANNRPLGTTHVDLEDDGVWMQQYLQHRLERCSHEEAARRVFAQIDGQPLGPGC